MQTQKNCLKRGKIAMSKCCMRIFVFFLLIWTLCGYSSNNVGEQYSYQSNQGGTLHLRDGRILTTVTSSKRHSGCDSGSGKCSNTVRRENQENEKTGIDGKPSSGITNKPRDEKVSEDTKQLRCTRNNVNGARSKPSKTKRDDFPVTPMLFAELFLKEPEKGIDIIMLYVGGFLKYACNHFS
ncbi:hypothetical protein C922_05233 [Plasmodium inui San Antonio 1]|uniref:Uncharacterized protein n=1 Tax=Plasmodium inui San Antonio 1 TaxID=1237626 RepID=W6ZYG8_9APIC|nr:hypothetical protein C922_05233 [Plasmodium inui San Antonio 1]EUD64383.1 hypothetical protein C922_05233 [Plasmodium inui San Antonio 1]